MPNQSCRRTSFSPTMRPSTPTASSPLLAMLLALCLALSTTMATQALAEAPLVNINEADAETLADLDGIGPAKARAIIEFRETQGRFVTVDHLEEVSGIGLTTVENNRDRLTVGEPPDNEASGPSQD
ncbi:MAG: ComEA family DNA-binding protein [Oleiphilaceae bacterium]|nr:ComEA family DNA-binding protein [Oleiphilaceae bacterium]